MHFCAEFCRLSESHDNFKQALTISPQGVSFIVLYCIYFCSNFDLLAITRNHQGKKCCSPKLGKTKISRLSILFSVNCKRLQVDYVTVTEVTLPIPTAYF